MNTSHPRGDGHATEAIYSSVVLDESCIPSAQAVLARYKEKGVILSGALEDQLLVTTNERCHVTLDFSMMDPDSYARNWESLFGVSFEVFKTRVKCGLILKLGEASLQTLQACVRDFTCFVSLKKEELAEAVKKGKISKAGLFLDIFLRLPVAQEQEILRDRLADQVDKADLPHHSGRRTLADLFSCFTLDSILKKHWPQATEEEKCVLWPVYLFWNICMIIPTRPMEFILTPEDCLYQLEDGEWMLKMRKSRLKGRKSEPVGYCLDEDYIIESYPIPDWIAQSILDYKSLLKRMDLRPARLGTLFSPVLHRTVLGRRPSRSLYYTYGDFTCALHYLYSEVVEKKYGFTTCFNPDELSGLETENRISYIRPGEARHFSMVNMAAEGVPIEILVKLAHHGSAKQSVHYAGNMDSYLKSATHRAYSEMKQRLSTIVPGPRNAVVPKKGDPFVELDEGRCYSPRFLVDDVSDCMQHMGPNKELAWCASCRYFRNSNPTLTMSDCKHLLLAVDDDWHLLREMIDSYRKEYVGMQEEILRVIQRLQTDQNILRRYLDRKVEQRKESVEDGGNID